jgi:hypothetical protein
VKIAFDFNGVIDTFPSVIIPLMQLLRESGHEVGLCTGNASWAFPQDIKDAFDFTIFCDSPEEEMRVAGRVSSKHEDKMRYWKSAALKEHKVDLIFEDYAHMIEGVTAIQIGTPVKTTYEA